MTELQSLPPDQADPEYFSVALRKFQDETVVYDFCFSSVTSVVNNSMPLPAKSN
ncbi:hypothetical protein C900_04506 [Fulvivirga imtechensis AK7]|uniref:Uncharacterized protein n=1 Tax=Fulvivirga imtechensis AK7 TaxID=1237149 RepID=L8JP56_9BACT|nr:hypothetical protein C900_04506 [Fulvivirga imtechensis AK7]